MISSTKGQRESSTKPPVYLGSAATLNEKVEWESRGMQSQHKQLKKRNQHPIPDVVLAPNPSVRVYNVGGCQSTCLAATPTQASSPWESSDPPHPRPGVPGSPPPGRARAAKAAQRQAEGAQEQAVGGCRLHRAPSQRTTHSRAQMLSSEISGARPCVSLKMDRTPEAHL